MSESTSQSYDEIIAEYKESPEYAEEPRTLQQSIAEQIVMSSQYSAKSEEKFRAGFEALQEVCAQHYPDIDFSIFSLIRREGEVPPMVVVDLPEEGETSDNPLHVDEASLEGREDVHEASTGAGKTGSETARPKEGVHSGTVSLNYLLSIQKPYGDSTGIGYH